jgi:hypothetical protein
MKKIIALALCAFGSLGIVAQNSFKTQTLYVVTHVEDQKFVDKLTKKKKTEKLELYRKLINDYNTNIKDAVNKYMTSFGKVEFKTETEVDALKPEELVGKNFLLHSFAMDVNPTGTTRDAFGRMVTGPTWTDNTLESVELDTTNKTQYSIIDVRTYDKKEKSMVPVAGKNGSIVGKNLPYLFCSRGEIFFSIRMLNNDFSDAPVAAGKKVDALKAKTLLLVSDDLDKGVTTDAEIKKVYPYPFKIVSRAERDKAILGEDKTTICALLLPMVKAAAPMTGPSAFIRVTKTTVIYFHMLYDTDKGVPYLGAAKMKGGAYGGGNNKISKDDLEDYKKDQ